MDSVTVNEIYGNDGDTHEVARLPGEDLEQTETRDMHEALPEPGSAGLSADPQARPLKSSKGNFALYAGVGMVTLLMAASYVYLRPAINPHQVLAIRATTAIPVIPAPAPAPAPLAPAATLAKVPVPHLPTAVIHQKYVPQSLATQLSELNAFRAGTQQFDPAIPASEAYAGAGPTPALHKALPQAPATNHPSAAVLAAQRGKSASSPTLATAAPAVAPQALTGSTTALTSSGSPNAGATASAEKPPLISTAVILKPGRPPVASSKPINSAVSKQSAAIAPVSPLAGSSLASAQAGALSPAQQTSLFQLVTQLGALERNDEIRQAMLAGQVQQLTLMMSGKMADYDRRLSMLEAQTAVSGATHAASNTVVTAAIGSGSARVSTHSVVAATPPASPANSAALSPSSAAVAAQYHVQAASPGLAMLSALGGGQPLEVQTGDIIPGYGRVLGVVQQGDSWVVQTQSGNIQ